MHRMGKKKTEEDVIVTLQKRRRSKEICSDGIQRERGRGFIMIKQKK